MIGFSANNATQRYQRIIFFTFSQRLQRHRHFQRTRHLDMKNVFFFHAKQHQFALAGVEQRIGHTFIEARLHNAHRQLFAIQPVGYSLVCTKHGDFL